MPLLKSKVKDPATSINSRPIAIATVLSKVVEKVVLHRLKTNLYTLDGQLQLQEGTWHGGVCVWTLKNMIQYYTSRGSAVYLCLLDASKAFDSELLFFFLYLFYFLLYETIDASRLYGGSDGLASCLLFGVGF